MPILRRVLRVALSLAVFVLVLRTVGTQEVVQSFLGMSPMFLAGALALVVFDSLLRGANWFQLLNRFVRLSFLQAWVAYLTGGFYGSLLPATVGTDAGRAMTISRRASLDIRVSVGSLVTLNLIGLAAVATVGTLGALFLSSQSQTAFLLIDIAFNGLLAMTLGVLLFTVLGQRLIEFLSSVTGLWPAAHRMLEPLLSATLVLPAARRRQLVLVGVALSSQVIRTSVATIVATSLGLAIDWWVFAAIAPMSALVAMIPLSVLGIGIEQGAMVFLLSHFGVAGSDAFATSVAIASVYLGLTLVGGMAVIADSAFGPQTRQGSDSGRERLQTRPGPETKRGP